MTKSIYADLKESVKTEMSEALLKWLITYFKISFLKNSPDMFKALSLPISLLVGYLLPDGTLANEIGSAITMRFPEVASDRVKDWDDAKRKYGESQRPKIKNVPDSDVAKFKRYLRFPSRDKSLAELANNFGELGRSIADKLSKINLSNLKKIIPGMPDLKVWDEALIKLTPKIDVATTVVDSIKTKPFTRETKTSRWIDSITAKIK